MLSALYGKDTNRTSLEMYKKSWLSSFTIIHFIRGCGCFINAGQQTAPAAASAFQGYFMSVLEHLAYIS